mmetsp:Transcript_119/g.270  ORF Transcript_119/g.270 Transcript_119/m.270 type:complete len:609 (-) Transcript_119:1556-3382(-)
MRLLRCLLHWLSVLQFGQSHTVWHMEAQLCRSWLLRSSKRVFLKGNITQHLRAKVKSDALSRIIAKHIESDSPKLNLTEHKKSVSTARNQTSFNDDKSAVNARNTSGHGVFNRLQNGKKMKLKSSEAKDAPLIPSKLSKELTHVISKIVQQAAEAEASRSKEKEEKPLKSNKNKLQFYSNPDAPKIPETIEGAGLNESSRYEAVESEPPGPWTGLEYKRIPLTYLAWFTAALCVISTMLISTSLILRHLDYYACPDTQKYVVRILFMAPIYAVDSLLALTFVGWATTYIDVFRDCYEAFTIYNFLKLLIVLLGGERAVIEMLEKKPQMQMIFPLHWLEPWEMGAEMFYSCKYGALQYVLVKPTCALITFVSGAAGIYGPNTFSLARLHFYVFFFSNMSQMWALYCLLMFYLTLKDELGPYNPVLKFFIVKAVVFFCFWQGMLLGLLAYLGYIPASGSFSSDSIVEAIQELLVCVEMVVVSLLFHYAFPVEEFVDIEDINGQRQNMGKETKFQQIRHNLADPFRVQDLRDDIHVYGSEQHQKLYGAVQATQEGINTVISARFRPLSARGRESGENVGSPSASPGGSVFGRWGERGESNSQQDASLRASR